MEQTVAQYVVDQLYALGITEVFGVPGDYAFPIDKAIVDHPHMRWIGSSNELNASYAANAYARAKGLAAICTTMGVGELSAINGIAGGYAEYVPIFHIAGMEATKTRESGLIPVHALDVGKYDSFFKMVEPVVCARTILTPENCITEMRRVIAAALYERRPVYIGIPLDCSTSPVKGNVDGEPTSPVLPGSDPEALEAAVEAIVAAISHAKTACMFPGILTTRFGLHKEMLALLEASGLPFAGTMMDKSVIDSTHPSYLGMYLGHTMKEESWKFIESCDYVLAPGVALVASSIGSGNLDLSRLISILPHYIRIGSSVFQHVEMKDVLLALTERLPKYSGSMGPKFEVPLLPVPQVEEDALINADYLYGRWNRFIQPGDNIMVEWGSMTATFLAMNFPAGVTFYSDSLWSSIGWANVAVLGALIADPSRRTVLFTGDGAHQMAVQELGQMARHKLKPIIFVLKNDVYMVENLTGGQYAGSYNDLTPWNYPAVAQAKGCTDWFTATVKTCGELDQAIKQAETCGTGAYIEVAVGKDVILPTTLTSLSSLMSS